MTEEAIFLDALERSPEDRAAFLATACGGNAALQARLEALLRAHEQPGSFLQAAADPPPLTTATEIRLETPAGRQDRTVSPYKLLQLIGEGGMGAVWMAEQTHPVRRQVALKLIK